MAGKDRYVYPFFGIENHLIAVHRYIYIDNNETTIMIVMDHFLLQS